MSNNELLRSEMQNRINKIMSRSIYLFENKAVSMYTSEYQKKAIDFLFETQTKCDIEKIGLDKPQWGKSKVNKYSVTLKNKKHSFTFDFYDSINNTENKKDASLDFYSVLSCLGHYTPESFDDFCAEFGYEFKNETEYIKVKSTHLACLDQDKNIKKLFTIEELNKLSEIN